MKFFILSFAFVFINFTFFSQAGPLVGQIVINKGDMKVIWEQKVYYEFTVKNAGKAPLNIIKIIGSLVVRLSTLETFRLLQQEKMELLE